MLAVSLSLRYMFLENQNCVHFVKKRFFVGILCLYPSSEQRHWKILSCTNFLRRLVWQTAWEDIGNVYNKDNGSFWGKSWAGLLAAPFKDCSFLSLEFLTWHTDPLWAQHPHWLFAPPRGTFRATGTNVHMQLWLPVMSAVLWVIKFFASGPGVSCLLPVTISWAG